MKHILWTLQAWWNHSAISRWLHPLPALAEMTGNDEPFDHSGLVLTVEVYEGEK